MIIMTNLREIFNANYNIFFTFFTFLLLITLIINKYNLKSLSITVITTGIILILSSFIINTIFKTTFNPYITTVVLPIINTIQINIIIYSTSIIIAGIVLNAYTKIKKLS